MSEDLTNDSTESSHRASSAMRQLQSVPMQRWLLFAILAIVLLALYGLLLGRLISVQAFVQNGTFYDVASLVFTLLIAALGALALTQSVQFARDNQAHWFIGSIVWALAGIGLGAVSTGCSICQSSQLPALGIADGLAAFPLGGLELKLLGLLVLAGNVWENLRIMADDHTPVSDALLHIENEMVIIGPQLFRYTKVAGVIGVALIGLYLVPAISAQAGLSNRAQWVQSQASSGSRSIDQLIMEVNPPQGYALSTQYGDIGPKLIAAGAIDKERFIQLYADGGNPLTDEQLEILIDGSDSSITINRQNAHFLLNLLWALGLANENEILEEGPLMQASNGQIEQFASTGGWTLGTISSGELYSSTSILSLTQEQQALVEEAAANTYRPCCNNSTAFADCNHGMAMLGLFELMASQGASLDDMYQAAKYFNAFWFPQQAVNLALYFETTTGQSFAEVEPRIVVSAQHSSGSGAGVVQQWLADNGKLEPIPGGGNCGV